MRLVGLALLFLLCATPDCWAQSQGSAKTEASSTAAEQPVTEGAAQVADVKPQVEPVTKAEQPSGLTKPAVLQSSERPTAGISLGKMALSLLLVVAIVIALGWAFKKLTLRLPGSKHIKIISSMPLGPKERLLVIEMQGKQRVLGVTAHSINLLFELENSLPEEKLASDFHTQLQSFLKK
ncbi:MAG: flagellar biosynthetic protein FliO [Chromatiaceae bacterium]|nr:flagellar biosynthetic protein FliO [Chromatiaceae bacterium]